MLSIKLLYILYKILHINSILFMFPCSSHTISVFVYIAHNVNFHPFESTLFNFQLQCRRLRYFRHAAESSLKIHTYAQSPHLLTYTFGEFIYNHKLFYPLSLFSQHVPSSLSLSMWPWTQKNEFNMNTQMTMSREF